MAYICEDAYVRAEHTERDSDVWKDDTVEMFTTLDLGLSQACFYIEMNVPGIFLDQFHPDGPDVPVSGIVKDLRSARRSSGR